MDTNTDEKECMFSEFEFYGVKVRLVEPITAEISREEGYIWLTYERGVVRFISNGETLEDAMRDFEADIVTSLLGYVNEPDERLTRDAIELREALRGMVVDWENIAKELSEA